MDTDLQNNLQFDKDGKPISNKPRTRTQRGGHGPTMRQNVDTRDRDDDFREPEEYGFRGRGSQSRGAANPRGNRGARGTGRGRGYAPRGTENRNHDRDERSNDQKEKYTIKKKQTEVQPSEDDPWDYLKSDDKQQKASPFDDEHYDEMAEAQEDAAYSKQDPRDKNKQSQRGGHGKAGERDHHNKDRDNQDRNRKRDGNATASKQPQPFADLPKKDVYDQCLICCENIIYYAVGECGHNTICWNCCLRNRLKMQDEKCPMCKEMMRKPYFTSKADETLNDNKQAICDPQLEIYFENAQCKNYISTHLGFFCQSCFKQNGEIRKFPSLESLDLHYDKAHRLNMCNLCVKEKPILLFEQQLYKWRNLGDHKTQAHPKCQYCPQKRFYDPDALIKHYRDSHYSCDVCKKQGKKQRNAKTGLIEYRVFKDVEDLRIHYRKAHIVCRKNKPECLDLAFTDQASLAQHYLIVHNQVLDVMLDFKYSDDEEEKQDDAEQRKKYNKQKAKRNGGHADEYEQDTPTTQQNYVQDTSQFEPAPTITNTGQEEMSFNDQNWVKNNKEYRDEFPTMGKGKKKQILNQYSKTDFESAFNLSASSPNKKPVKFSDSMAGIMRKQNQVHKAKLAQKYNGAISNQVNKKYDQPMNGMVQNNNNQFTMKEAQSQAQRKRFLNTIDDRIDNKCDDSMMYDENAGNVLQVHKVAKQDTTGVGGKKGKKKGAIKVECDSELTEAQHNEYPVLVKDEPVPKKNKNGGDLKLSLWEKQQIAKHEKETAYNEPCEDDVGFRYNDLIEEVKTEQFPAFEAAPKKIDDSRTIVRGPGKKNKNKNKSNKQWSSFNPNGLPKNTDLNQLYK